MSPTTSRRSSLLFPFVRCISSCYCVSLLNKRLHLDPFYLSVLFPILSQIYCKLYHNSLINLWNFHCKWAELTKYFLCIKLGHTNPKPIGHTKAQVQHVHSSSVPPKRTNSVSSICSVCDCLISESPIDINQRHQCQGWATIFAILKCLFLSTPLNDSFPLRAS